MSMYSLVGQDGEKAFRKSEQLEQMQENMKRLDSGMGMRMKGLK